jgi:hypothetical protein
MVFNNIYTIKLLVIFNIRFIFFLNYLLISEPDKNRDAYDDEKNANHQKLKTICVFNNNIPRRTKNKPQNRINHGPGES